MHRQVQEVQQAMLWGEVNYEFGSFEHMPKWMPLDPDMSPHVCGETTLPRVSSLGA